MEIIAVIYQLTHKTIEVEHHDQPSPAQQGRMYEGKIHFCMNHCWSWSEWLWFKDFSINQFWNHAGTLTVKQQFLNQCSSMQLWQF